MKLTEIYVTNSVNLGSTDVQKLEDLVHVWEWHQTKNPFFHKSSLSNSRCPEILPVLFSVAQNLFPVFAWNSNLLEFHSSDQKQLLQIWQLLLNLVHIRLYALPDALEKFGHSNARRRCRFWGSFGRWSAETSWAWAKKTMNASSGCHSHGRPKPSSSTRLITQERFGPAVSLEASLT